MWSRIASLWGRVALDKKAHFLAGAVAALLVGKFLHSYGYSLMAAALAGALKEYFDRKTGGVVDPYDFLATFLGGVVFGVFAWL